MPQIKRILEVCKILGVESVTISYEAKLDGIKFHMLAKSSQNAEPVEMPFKELKSIKKELNDSLKKLALEKFKFMLGDIGRYKGEDGTIELTLHDDCIYMTKKKNETFTRKQSAGSIELHLSDGELFTLDNISRFKVKMGERNRTVIEYKGPCSVSNLDEEVMRLIFQSLNKFGVGLKKVDSDEIHYEMESRIGNTLTVDFTRVYHETTYDAGLEVVTIVPDQE